MDGDLESGGRVAEGILKSCEMRKEWEREGREGFKKELEEIKRWGRRGSYEELMKLESREYKKEAWKVSPRD